MIDPTFEIDDDDTPPRSRFRTVLSRRRLQDVADYRQALRTWFGAVEPGGHLVVTVPHAFLYERLLALPSPWRPRQRRLYTPAALLQEVEEALVPNSYRVRVLCDDDEGYDYAQPGDAPPEGASDVLLILEKIVQPAWVPRTTAPVAPDQIKGAAPAYAFEPAHTRVETPTLRSRRRIVILKLDHLGDFIMSLPALEKARAMFADAHITLVVGSWNVDMARAAGLADEVIAFDIFPRNSTEEEVDVAGKHALFQATIQGTYDLAIDLRSDKDTRFLLRSVRATLRAGLGTRAEFPFLDIFLPLDFTRNEPETAKETLLNHHTFAAQGSTVRHDHRIFSAGPTVERDCAIVWGPYWTLRPGNYLFEPHFEVDPNGVGIIKLDVALDADEVASRLITGPERDVRLSFHVPDRRAKFEFRIWAVDDAPALDVSFYGGRLIRQGAASVLHQSEYQSLLIQLVADRLDRTGLLEDIGAA